MDIYVYVAMYAISGISYPYIICQIHFRLKNMLIDLLLKEFQLKTRALIIKVLRSVMWRQDDAIDIQMH